jgi:hypothetical protein
MWRKTTKGARARLTAGRRGMRGYLVSQAKRKRVEEIFGWMKIVGGMRKLRHRALHSVGWMFTFAAAAYNLGRIRNLANAIAVVNVLSSSVSILAPRPIRNTNCIERPRIEPHNIVGRQY